MLFGDLVGVCGVVTDADARADKVRHLGAALRGLSPTEASLSVELLLRAELFQQAAPLPGDFNLEPREQHGLSCEQVAEALAEIDRIPAAALRRNLSRQLLTRATEDEQRWLLDAIDRRRIDRPTFDLIVTSAAAAARTSVGGLRRAATLAGSLPLAVRIAFDRGDSGLDSVAFEPGRPIPPTVAESSASPSSLSQLPQPSVVEWNVVADRIQVHRLRGEIRVYDDRLVDVTDLVPVVVDQVSAFPRDDLVLDGWVDINRESDAPSSAVAGWSLRSGSRRVRERAVFFDVLFDGAPVVDEPLSERRKLLADIVPEDSLLPLLDVSDLDGVATAMNDGQRLGHDGVVIKPLGKPYEGGLVRSTWRTVDSAHVVRLAVVGARQGRGGRSALLSTVHLAARDEDGRLREVVKTARGLSEEMIVRQTGWFTPLIIDDSGIDSSRVIRLRPLMAAVVAVEGVDTDASTGEITVRQPWIIGYSEPAELEVTTIAELTEIAADDVVERAVENEEAVPALPAGGDVTPEAPYLPARDLGERVVTAEPVAGRPADSESLAPSVGSRPPTVSAGRGLVDQMDFEPYHEAELTSSRSPKLRVARVRAMGLVWVLALLAATLLERSGDDGFDPTIVVRVGWIGGVLLTILLVATGWHWSDHLVRTLILLGGRKPTRLRCVTAWASVPVVVLLLALLLVPLDPTQPADVRPAITVVSFAFVMWRPYALIRRILFTLTRLRSDPLIASAYIIDVLSWGLLWWRLTLLVQGGDDVSGGAVDILVGALAATAISTAIGVAVWFGLLRAADTAVAQRRASQRTRYEHRMLRLNGVDPTDPEVWWALVQRRADEQRAAEAEIEAEARTELPTVDELVESARLEHTVAFRRLDEDESSELVDRLREEFAAILGEGLQLPDDAADSVVSTDVGELPTLPGQFEPIATGDRTAEQAQPVAFDEDPIEALRRRARRETEVERVRGDIEVLIGKAGSLQIDAAIDAHRDRMKRESPDDRLVPTRVFAIEAARLVGATAFAALTVATGWLVVTAMGSDAAADTGQLSASVVDDLELARRLFWGMLTVGGALVPLWSVTVLRRARGAGVDGVRMRRAVVLSVVAIGACVAGFVFDGTERGPLTFALAFPIIWSAVSAGFGIEPVRVWFGLPSSTLTACISTLPVILLVAWLAQLVGPIEPSISLQRLAFTTILLGLACVRVAVMFVLTSVDIEDALRVSPQVNRAHTGAVRP